MTTLDDKTKAALQRADSKGVGFEMTPELREKFCRVSTELVDFIKARTTGPLEAYAILRFVCDGFESTYDIRGSTMISKKDETA